MVGSRVSRIGLLHMVKRGKYMFVSRENNSLGLTVNVGCKAYGDAWQIPKALHPNGDQLSLSPASFFHAYSFSPSPSFPTPTADAVVATPANGTIAAGAPRRSSSPPTTALSLSPKSDPTASLTDMEMMAASTFAPYLITRSSIGPLQ